MDACFQKRNQANKTLIAYLTKFLFVFEFYYLQTTHYGTSKKRYYSPQEKEASFRERERLSLGQKVKIQAGQAGLNEGLVLCIPRQKNQKETGEAIMAN